MKKALRILWTSVLAYLVVVAAMYLLQRDLLYLPEKSDSLQLAQYNLTGEDLRLTSEDGVTIQAWYMPPRDGYPTIVYFHGNAGNLGNRAKRFEGLHNNGFGVMALSYRGYGESSGTPTEDGIYADARSVISYLRNSRHTAFKDMILYGESLGSGVAVQMAMEFPVRMVVLESPYTSVTARAAEIYPWLPVKWMLRDNFASDRKISAINAPLLIIHGGKDQVIPIHHGRELLMAAKEPKKGVFYENGGHANFDIKIIIKEISAFLKETDNNSTNTTYEEGF